MSDIRTCIKLYTSTDNDTITKARLISPSSEYAQYDSTFSFQFYSSITNEKYVVNMYALVKAFKEYSMSTLIDTAKKVIGVDNLVFGQKPLGDNSIQEAELNDAVEKDFALLLEYVDYDPTNMNRICIHLEEEDNNDQANIIIAYLGDIEFFSLEETLQIGTVVQYAIASVHPDEAYLKELESKEKDN